MKRDLHFIVRVARQEKDGFEAAAEIAGVGVSTWARERLRSAATHELERAGRKAPFLKPIPIGGNEHGS
jgi:hypothetical protein